MSTMTKERKPKARADGGISLSVAELKTALAAVASAVPARSPRPVLQNVLLSGGVLSGSDGDLRIDVQVSYDGPAVLLPFGRFQAISKTAPCETLSIMPDGNACLVKAKNSQWFLQTENPAEYPSWKVSNARPIAKLPADQFVRAIKGVIKSIDKESTRYALGGVLVEVRGDSISFVATDGRRLSSVTFEHDSAVDDSSSLVPCSAFEKALRLIPSNKKRREEDDADEDDDVEYDCDHLAVQIEASASEMVLTIGRMNEQVVSPWRVAIVRLLEGKFPKWRDVVPERDAKATTVRRDALMAATRAAAIVTSEQSKGVSYTFANDGIHLHAKSAECGESSVTCYVVEAGDKATVSLDPKFVTEWLKGVEDRDAKPEVEVEAVDEQSAVVLRCGDHTGVIMPLAKD